MKPAVIGIPANDNNERVKTIATQGFFQNNPLKASIFSVSDLQVERSVITPKAPIVVTKYDMR